MDSGDGQTERTIPDDKETGPSPSAHQPGTTKPGDDKIGAEAGEPPIEGSVRDEVFDLYKKALEKADWGYKSKTGEERDISYKSTAVADKAYISAALYDESAASRLYEESSGKPPTEDLLGRLARMKGLKPEHGVAELTAGLAEVDGKREVLKLSMKNDSISKQISAWDSVMGDERNRAADHRRKANEEILSPEPNRDDSGLHILSALKSGFKAGQDYNIARRHAAKDRAMREGYKDHVNEYGQNQTKIASFGNVAGGSDDVTIGEEGKNASRYAGAITVVKEAFSLRTRNVKANDNDRANDVNPSKDAGKPEGIQAGADRMTKVASMINGGLGGGMQR